MDKHTAMLKRMRAILEQRGIGINVHRCGSDKCLCPDAFKTLRDSFGAPTCARAHLPGRGYALFGWNEDMSDCWFTQDTRDDCQEGNWMSTCEVCEECLEAFHQAKTEG